MTDRWDLEAAIVALKEMDRNKPCTYYIHERVKGKLICHEVKGTDAMCHIQDLINAFNFKEKENEGDDEDDGR